MVSHQDERDDEADGRAAEQEEQLENRTHVNYSAGPARAGNLICPGRWNDESYLD